MNLYFQLDLANNWQLKIYEQINYLNRTFTLNQ